MADILVKNKNEQNRQRILIAVFVVVLIITLFVLWWGFLKPQTPTIYVGNSGGGNSQYGEVRIDFNILENAFLKELLPFKNIAPLQNNLGRDNPFLPLVENGENI